MCLALVALGAHERYALVVAANRDEFHARATAPANWWDEGWLAGRDLAASGTWLGVTRGGRWALITNVREPARHDPSAPSRGALVTGLLADSAPVPEGLGRILGAATRHNGFNLVAGTARDAHWGSNRAEGTRALAPGVHGVSNATLDTVAEVADRAAVAAWCAQTPTSRRCSTCSRTARSPRRRAARNRHPQSDGSCPPFIVGLDYGTRCSTVLAIRRDGEVRFVERSFDLAGRSTVVIDERFRVRA
jgi:uncharacterized protein with NRDE domain